MSLVVFDMGRRVETPVQPDRLRTHKTAATTALHDGQPSTHGYDAIADDAYQQAQQRPPQPVAYVQDIMSADVETLSPSDSLGLALRRFKNSSFHHFPVVDEQLQVHGILSDRDALNAMLQHTDIQHHPVSRYASHPVVCIRPSADIRQAAQTLYQYNIGALPVINEQQQLCGILTPSDILRTLSHYGPMELWA
ncbi:hypothetical protein CHH28_01165 [Bacterioplanes sanyensis]|uniref:CBS domain-containing protein n=1 Tax=Bacterioplanes sanyensis TaxID=1249553 RepID=A0A222FE57_9GAMM|nr:CBS domain-containing protein [Bacterioplanes sanyensis]ASP37375.1 hypothetical protein CHH28_01165 [Bacterioplanes sanyensis]